jgi:hypothetical protein
MIQIWIFSTLVERDLIAGAVVELGGARALVRGHRLRVFERAAALEVGSDAGRPEHVTAEPVLEPELLQGVSPPHGRDDPVGSRLCCRLSAARTAAQPALARSEAGSAQARHHRGVVRFPDGS